MQCKRYVLLAATLACEDVRVQVQSCYGWHPNIATISTNQVNSSQWTAKENSHPTQYFLHVSGPWDFPGIAQNGQVAVFVPTNLDLANILGMMDLNFEKSDFYLFRSQMSKISKLLGRASSTLLQYF